MDVPIAVTKKKKRKTRKRLDEIRKRSRRKPGSDFSRENFQQQSKVIKPKGDHVNSHRFITMNRLTLNIFPRAIRSETITRPQLEDKIKKTSYLESEKNILCASNTKDYEVDCFQCLASNNSMPIFDLNKSLHEHRSTIIDEVSGTSRNLQSPTQIDILDSPAALLYSSSSSTAQTFNEHGPELYEELMNKISIHLKDITSAVMKEDLIKATKVKLLKLKKMSWSGEYQTSLLEQEKSNELTTTQVSKEPVTQSLLEYAKLKYLGQESVYDSTSSVSDTVDCPLPARAAPPTAECMHHVHFYDTPEYNYYPHRLS